MFTYATKITSHPPPLIFAALQNRCSDFLCIFIHSRKNGENASPFVTIARAFETKLGWNLASCCFERTYSVLKRNCSGKFVRISGSNTV